jgi:hypothetical protein
MERLKAIKSAKFGENPNFPVIIQPERLYGGKQLLSRRSALGVSMLLDGADTVLYNAFSG